MPFMRTDQWQTGIIRASMASILQAGTLEGFSPHWIGNDHGLRFLADPFGLWHEQNLYVFAEAYDYRTKCGKIDMLQFDASFRFIRRARVLAEPWHLSYPVVFRHDGAFWMLPEAHRSGTLSLYRAAHFPDRWEKIDHFSFPVAAIDASPIFFNGLWWMFFSPPGSAREKKSMLCAAFSEHLTGPWHLHPANPIRENLASGRPGGSPLIDGDDILLPTQDCTKTYGGAISIVRISGLSPTSCTTSVTTRLVAPPAFRPWTDGLHTLSAAGDVTLIDAKHISHSPLRHVHDVKRWLQKTATRTSP